MGDVLSINNVTLRRSGNNILKGVSWDINSDERWVVLGPNGAGKTTIVQIVATRLFPTTGTVDIMGERLGRVDVRELRTMVGVTSSAVDRLIPRGETVFEAVRTAAYGQMAAWDEEYDVQDDARARAIMVQMGIDIIADRRVAYLSSGELKRLGIARSLMPNPEILILDEPTSGLDLGGRERLLTTLSMMARQPYAPALILVTHHVEEIPVGFTHVLLLKEGDIYAAGPIDKVLTSETVSQVFDYPITITKDGGRYFARS
ncbi:ABC transporter ATP-binding protein [Actinotignum urinale]|uniref:ATP-binding cassette domain-containing protein n=1 Tax=Actinotignum urinale TaxID=190146 RepID=A0AAW9HP17_9ACTO|nr:ATP-binding cassette domain-containing protein [Actinotignum urinale]MDY5154472.1 ATP-binding cassette domain-containing protein [Actinotignum urinale]